jgi:hypothetical protein
LPAALGVVVAEATMEVADDLTPAATLEPEAITLEIAVAPEAEAPARADEAEARMADDCEARSEAMEPDADCTADSTDDAADPATEVAEDTAEPSEEATEERTELAAEAADPATEVAEVAAEPATVVAPETLPMAKLPEVERSLPTWTESTQNGQDCHMMEGIIKSELTVDHVAGTVGGVGHTDDGATTREVNVGLERHVHAAAVEDDITTTGLGGPGDIVGLVGVPNGRSAGV